MNSLLRYRRRRLRYYLKSAITPMARMYWLGRLDEIKKLSVLTRRSTNKATKISASTTSRSKE